MDLYAFKIYMLDVGLLLAMADLDASVIIDGNRIFTLEQLVPDTINFCKVKNQKLFGWVWFALWIALSVFFIVEFGFGDGHMPLVVKEIVIGAVLVLLWYDFIRYCRKKRKYTVKYGKTTAP